jgi:hypothetical protein
MGEPAYNAAMLERMRLEDLAGRIQTAIRACNPKVLKYCREYHATPQRQMTPDDVVRLLAAQDVHCGLCPLSLEVTPWCIDHDHEIERLTGVKLVRGFICTRCNGWLGKHEERAQRISDYAKGILARSTLK